VKAAMLAIMICGALALAGCGDDDSSTDSTATGEATTEQPSGSSGSASGANVDTSKKPTVEVPSGSPPAKLVENELVEGDGATAKNGDEVTVNYVGVGYESGEEFDASWGREPFTFSLGGGEVISGWDQGIEGMKVGGRRELIIPPELAYGEAGYPPSIGQNETLIFVVDLLAVR
jgi:peptidylprolyl isomerase